MVLNHHVFDVDVGNVQVRGGGAPGDVFVAAQEDPRETGEGGARHVEVAGVQVHQVPDGRQAQVEVRVVRQQRLSVGRARGRHDPAVRSDAGLFRVAMRQGFGGRGQGESCFGQAALQGLELPEGVELRLGVSVQASGAAGVRRDRGPGCGHLGQQVCELRRVQGEGGLTVGDFAAGPVGQTVDQQKHRAGAVSHGPVFDQIFERRPILGHAGAVATVSQVGDPSVHAPGVGPKIGQGFVAGRVEELVDHRFPGPGGEHGSGLSVLRDRGAAEPDGAVQLGQSTLRRPAAEIHLTEPVRCVEVAFDRHAIFGRCAFRVQDPSCIEAHGHWTVESGDFQGRGVRAAVRVRSDVGARDPQVARTPVGPGPVAGVGRRIGVAVAACEQPGDSGDEGGLPRTHRHELGLKPDGMPHPK